MARPSIRGRAARSALHGRLRHQGAARASRERRRRERRWEGQRSIDTEEALTAFRHVDGELWCERVPLERVAAEFGTPCYVYSRAAIETNFRAFDAALAGLPHVVCYAMKANANLAILQILARLGSGFDIVSGGELARVLAAGGDPRKTVFSGVGKTADEMRQALRAGIACFNVESEPELDRLASVAGAMGLRAPVSFRVNPDVDPKTHPYISTGLKENKFGIDFAAALPLYAKAAKLASIDLLGIDMHIGSQITELEPYRAAATKLLDLVDRLAASGIRLAHIDLGGGLGIRYRDERPVALDDYASMLEQLFAGRSETLLFEPGRRLTGDAGVLLTRVNYLKRGGARDFAIVDAAMNDLLRPALYDAWHPVEPVRPHGGEPRCWQVVGPVCESADFLAHDRMLALREGDLLAIGAAGAYAMAMSSNYNARPRACEVLIDGDRAHLARRRETYDELFASESLLPD
jgi:diaminopimelate decarboxylase